MLEIAKRDGVVGVRNDGRAQRFVWLDSFWNSVEKCHPFVFSPANEVPVDAGQDNAPVYGPDHRDLDAPFPVFSIEVLGQHICVPRPTDKQKIYIDCIMVTEFRPKEYGYVTSCINEKDGNKFIFASNAEGPIVEEFLKRLKREKTGIENARERVRVGTGQTKKVITIRKIVHVRPTRLQSPVSEMGRTIDWSHRWEVRGHWRKLEGGLGKDRDGNYCVEGWTWVKDFVKGPEGAILVKKTRLIHENSA